MIDAVRPAISTTMTVAEVAALMGVSTGCIYDHVRCGDIPNVGYGKTVRIPRVWVERRFAELDCPIEMQIETSGGTFA